MPNKGAKWIKPSLAIVQLFDELMPQGVTIERRNMFGFQCAFVNGNMFAWIHQNHIAIRLAEDARNNLIASKQARPVDPMGRRMREYIELDDELLDDSSKLEALIQQSLDYTALLPLKQKSTKNKEK